MRVGVRPCVTLSLSAILAVGAADLYAAQAAELVQQPVSQFSSQLPEGFPFAIPQVTSSALGFHSGRTIIPHDGAPVPVPFDERYLFGYISDISSYSHGFYLDVVDGFEDLRAHHPEVMRRNLEIVIDINNNATPERIAMAQHDALADQNGVLFATADALGPQARDALRASLQEGRLPKTEFLLGNGYAARAGGIAAATWFEKKIFNYPRPFVVAPEKIRRYQIGKRDLYKQTPSYPSGHTNQATWIMTLLATMLPEFGPQIFARGAESGESRLVMGVHYPLDVIGGGMMGRAVAADRLNDPKMRDALNQAAQELRAELEWRTGKSIEELAREAREQRSDADAVRIYTERMTYGFDPVYAQNAEMIVPVAAPALLEARFPDLSYEQRAEVLKRTAYPAGFPLDDQTAAGSWQRINLAAAWTADVTVNDDGSVTVQ